MSLDTDDEILAALPDARPSEALRMGFAKYTMFTGRASRSEYWWWTLITTVVGLLLAVVFVAFLVHGATATSDTDDSTAPTLLSVLPLGLLLLWSAAITVPTLAVTTRRLRDTGVPPTLTLLAVVPSGGLVLLALCARPSEDAAGSDTDGDVDRDAMTRPYDGLERVPRTR